MAPAFCRMYMPHIVRARGRPLFAALLLLAGARAGTAQAIAGRVIDAESRLPTRLLAVHVLGDSNHVVVSTRTDTAGIFYALLPTGGRFRVRFALDSTTTFDSDTIRVPGDEFVQREFPSVAVIWDEALQNAKGARCSAFCRIFD